MISASAILEFLARLRIAVMLPRRLAGDVGTTVSRGERGGARSVRFHEASKTMWAGPMDSR